MAGGVGVLPLDGIRVTKAAASDFVQQVPTKQSTSSPARKGLLRCVLSSETGGAPCCCMRKTWLHKGAKLHAKFTELLFKSMGTKLRKASSQSLAGTRERRATGGIQQVVPPFIRAKSKAPIEGSITSHCFRANYDRTRLQVLTRVFCARVKSELQISGEGDETFE